MRLRGGAPGKIRRHKPDLLFLDVQMPECDGFDVMELLGKDVPAAVVFVTAYDQYALRAFEAGALDYLLKPFDDARFGGRSIVPSRRSRAAKITPKAGVPHHQERRAGGVRQPAGDRLD